MLKRFVPLFLILALFSPLKVKAQEGITLPSAEVDFWPEYDKPSMLVIYRLTLPASVSLPYEMTARIPAAAGEPNAVASKQPDGALFNLPHDNQVVGEWSVLTFRATTPEIQIEYYDPGLKKQGNEREYVYQWPGDYAVDSLLIQIQQPFGATNMSISPALGSGRVGQDGLTYYGAEEGALAAGQPFSITIHYQKDTDTLSATTIQVQPSEPLTETPTSLNLASMLPWFLGGLGVLLIVGGAIWYRQSGRGETSQPQRRRRGKAQVASASAPAAETGFVYCHQCGKRAGPGDRFCRSCGTPLRTG
jgi:hypothetical protein